MEEPAPVVLPYWVCNACGYQWNLDWWVVNGAQVAAYGSQSVLG
jgi:hypothetical protein